MSGAWGVWGDLARDLWCSVSRINYFIAFQYIEDNFPYNPLYDGLPVIWSGLLYTK